MVELQLVPTSTTACATASTSSWQATACSGCACLVTPQRPARPQAAAAPSCALALHCPRCGMGLHWVRAIRHKHPASAPARPSCCHPASAPAAPCPCQAALAEKKPPKRPRRCCACCACCTSATSCSCSCSSSSSRAMSCWMRPRVALFSSSNLCSGSRAATGNQQGPGHAPPQATSRQRQQPAPASICHVLMYMRSSILCHSMAMS
jgi:hypothetical protein